MRPGAGDDLRRETEPLADRQRVARPGMPVLQPERRLEPLGVERDRRVLEPRLHLGEDLEGLEVRRDDDARPSVEQRLEERGAERRALDRIGARAELVEEDERPGPGDVEDLPHLADERRERREVLGQALLVADHRQHLVRERHPAPGGGGNVAPGLGHQDQEARRFERDGLAARVRAAQDQAGPIGRHPEVDRDDLARARRGAPPLGDQQRMPGRAEIEIAAGVHLGLGRVEPLGQRGAREDEIEGAEPLDELREGRQDVPHARRSALRARAAPRPARRGRAA